MREGKRRERRRGHRGTGASGRAWLAAALLGLLAWLPVPAVATPEAAAWGRFVEHVLRQPPLRRAESINLGVNQLEQADGRLPTAWQTPAELFARGMGDCKDFALAKFWLLRRTGVPREQVRLAYGDWQSPDERRPHLVVLLWVDGGSPLVLDNLVPGLHRLANRHDLTLRFSFDDAAFYEGSGPQRIRDQPLRGWRELRTRLEGLAPHPLPAPRPLRASTGSVRAGSAGAVDPTL